MLLSESRDSSAFGNPVIIMMMMRIIINIRIIVILILLILKNGLLALALTQLSVL